MLAAWRQGQWRGVAATVLLVAALGLGGTQSAGATPTPNWVRLAGTSSNDEAYGAAADASGNTYVAGYTCGALGGQPYSGQEDAFLSKYNSAGQVQWTRLLGTTGRESVQGVAADGSGNAYMAGWTSGALGGQANAGDFDAFLSKYNSAGQVQWTKLLGSTAADSAAGVAVDRSGNAYIAGSTYGNLGGQANSGYSDAFLSKFNSAGQVQWTRQLGSGSTFTTESANGVAVDGSGNAYIAGFTDGNLGGQTNAGGRDVFFSKYDSTGQAQWTKLLGSVADDLATSVAVDALGNVYIAGSTDGNLGGQTKTGTRDAFLSKFNAAGQVQWTRLLGVPDYGCGNDVTVDASGNAWVTGETRSSLAGQDNAGAADAFLFEYSATGDVLWKALLGSDVNDEAYAVALGSSGTIVMAGSTFGNLGGQTAAGFEDVFVAQYTPEPATLSLLALGGLALLRRRAC